MRGYGYRLERGLCIKWAPAGYPAVGRREARMMWLVQHNGWWYVLVREHGRSRVYQLESPPPKITWRDRPVIEMTPGRNSGD